MALAVVVVGKERFRATTGVAEQEELEGSIVIVGLVSIIIK